MTTPPPPAKATDNFRTFMKDIFQGAVTLDVQNPGTAGDNVEESMLKVFDLSHLQGADGTFDTRPSCKVEQKVYAKIKNVNLNELFKEWASAERKIVTAHLLSSEITALTVSVAVDMLVNAHNVHWHTIVAIFKTKEV